MILYITSPSSVWVLFSSISEYIVLIHSESPSPLLNVMNLGDGNCLVGISVRCTSVKIYLMQISLFLTCSLVK